MNYEPRVVRHGASYLSGGTLYGAASVWAVSNGQALTALGLVIVALLTLAILGLAHVLGPTRPT